MRHPYGQVSQVVRLGGCDEGEIAGRTARALYLSDVWMWPEADMAVRDSDVRFRG